MKKQIKPKLKNTPLVPKVNLRINKTSYNAIDPEKAMEVAKELNNQPGTYKVHVIYGEERISQRKKIVVENEGKYISAKETKQALKAFLDKSLWIRTSSI